MQSTSGKMKESLDVCTMMCVSDIKSTEKECKLSSYRLSEWKANECELGKKMNVSNGDKVAGHVEPVTKGG